MDVRSELAPAVFVAKEVAYYCEDDAEGLEGDVPTGADNLGRSIPGIERDYRGQVLTPRTMPVGKMRAKERVWIAMWSHSITSCGCSSILS